MVPLEVWIASTVLSMVLCAITPHPHVCNVSATLTHKQTNAMMRWSYPTNSVCSSSDRAGVADKEVSAVPVPVLVVHATEGWPMNTACKVEAKRERGLHPATTCRCTLLVTHLFPSKPRLLHIQSMDLVVAGDNIDTVPVTSNQCSCVDLAVGAERPLVAFVPGWRERRVSNVKLVTQLDEKPTNQPTTYLLIREVLVKPV